MEEQILPRKVIKVGYNKKPKTNHKKKIELDGRTWLNYSISVWNDVIKTKHEWVISHPAMFPEELPRRLIQIYTTKGNTVLDPFMGSGSVLVAANNLGRHGIGFEISEEFITLAKKRLDQTKLVGEQTNQIIFDKDAREMPRYIQPESVDLCITSPPYWDILRQERTADYKEIRPYSESNIDLGNIEDYGEFIGELKKVFENVYTVLKHGSRCAIVVMDIRKKNRFYPFHMDITKMMEGIGFELEDIIIWDRRSEYNNLRPLGYPYVFRVNKIHEYILIYIKNGIPEIGEDDG